MEACPKEGGIDDIEELSFADRPQGAPTSTTLNPRAEPRAKRQFKKDGRAENIPGVQTVYLKTWGCSHNVSDSEYMAGLLCDYGYGLTEDFGAADVYLFNSCTVKGPSQDAVMNLINDAKKTGKPIVVSGCVPQGQPSSKMWDGVSLVGVQQIDRVVEVVEEALKGNTVRFLKKSKNNKPSLDLPKIRKNPFVEIIPINVGCLNSCTYCKTKHARGHLASWTSEEICQRVRTSLDEGVMAVFMTSEDTGAYGRDIGTNLPALLADMLPLFTGHAMLRIGMTNPPYILEHLDQIVHALNSPNVFKFLHIPVQAGSNSVLAAMQRGYTVEQFQHVVDTVRAHVPHVTIATDIIAGFPTESEQDFEETFRLVGRNRFPVLFTNQFYARPGTPAARMKRVASARDVKQRTKRLVDLFHSFSSFDFLRDTEQTVWVLEVAPDNHHLGGRTEHFVQVLLDPATARLGDVVRCAITDVHKFHVVGRVVAHLQRGPKVAGRSLTAPRTSAKARQAQLHRMAADRAHQAAPHNNSSPWLRAAALALLALVLALVLALPAGWLPALPWSRTA
eukprot:CAMPEP_0177637492 /NCGR_PEP_ID=MMETSP0447-20121125/4999_1 /TAXON_ID=0 /ORGANISM="Stygamoeba regulata, Strain BSH-02190019" /LENGTH=561 /DNA_ID=CAMNT_0019139421 /DNA_START=70 /DNA_END=1755 /DNA_ORIENTATION=-